MGLLALFSCEKELVIVLPEAEPKLVVYAFLRNGEPLEARISKTRSALSDEPFVFPTDAWVELLADGVSVDTLTYGLSHTGAPRYRSRTVPQEGIQYTLRARWADLPEVSATAALPGPLSVAAWEWDTTYLQNPNLGENSYALDGRLTIADDPGEEDFYALQVAQIVQSFFTDAQGDTIYNAPDTLWVPLATDMSGPVLAYAGEGLLFADGALSDGQVHFSCRLAATDGFRRSLGFVLYAKRVSRDYYLFYRGVFQNGFSNDLSLFSEPVEVYNNISGGFGNFSGLQQVIFPVGW